MSEQERIEQLDAWIDQLLAGEPVESDADEKQIARAWSELSAQESPRLSNVARAREWKRLDTHLRGNTPPRKHHGFAWWLRVPRWAQIATIALVVVLVLNGINSVAANSLPGSFLYPFKRLGESGELLARLSPAERARLQMNFANRRLDEVQALLQRNERVDPAILDAIDESILAALSETINTRGVERAQLLQALAQLTRRQEEILRALAANASPAERERFLSSAQFLRGIADFAISAEASGDASPNELPTRVPSGSPSRTPTFVPTVTPTRATTVTADPTSGALNPTGDSQASTPPQSGRTRQPLSPLAVTRTPNATGSAQTVPTSKVFPSRTLTLPRASRPFETRPTHWNIPSRTRYPDRTPGSWWTPQPNETRAPRDTREPTRVHDPKPTREPPATREPRSTREPQATRRPTRERRTPRP